MMGSKLRTFAPQINLSLEELVPPPYIHFEMRFRLPVSTYIMDNSGTKQEVTEFILIGHCVLETETINTQIGSFGTAQIAYGKTETIDKKSVKQPQTTLMQAETRVFSPVMLHFGGRTEGSCQSQWN